MTTKELLGTISCAIIVVNITKIVPPEDYLCNVAAIGPSPSVRELAKDFALQRDSFQKLVQNYSRQNI